MKKRVAIISAVLVLLFASISYGASTSYIGKKVNGQVDMKINGEVIGQAVVIDGKSFIPVREISNEIGGSITIEKGGSIDLMIQETKVTSNDTAAIELLKRKISVYKSEVASLEKQVEEAKIKAEEDPREESLRKTNYEIMKKSLDKQKEKLSILEETLKELQ